MVDDEFKWIDHVDRYPPAIPRTQINDYFPFLKAKTLSNMSGKGPPAYRNGRAVIFPTKELLKWLDSRNQMISKDKKIEEKQKNRGRKTKIEEVKFRKK